MQGASGHKVSQLIGNCDQRNEVATVNAAVLVASFFVDRPNRTPVLICVVWLESLCDDAEIAEHIRTEAIAGERDITTLRVLLLRSLLPQSVELLARMRGRELHALR